MFYQEAAGTRCCFSFFFIRLCVSVSWFVPAGETRQEGQRGGTGPRGSQGGCVVVAVHRWRRLDLEICKRSREDWDALEHDLKKKTFNVAAPNLFALAEREHFQPSPLSRSYFMDPAPEPPNELHKINCMMSVMTSLQCVAI